MTQSAARAIEAEFLPQDASRDELIRASADNHTAWFASKARAAGGESRVTRGVHWSVNATEAYIAFPQITRAATCAALDDIVQECFQRKLKSASCWSLSLARPRDLGAIVAARGFEWGWRPHWMALDLSKLPTEAAVPDGVHVEADDESDWSAEDIPYYSRDDGACLRKLAMEEPRRIWHFAARVRGGIITGVPDGMVVGHSVLCLTTGPMGIAGIYSVGVSPAARNRGIGTAVSLAACQFARRLGCCHALLNSAADRLYESMGFVSLGYGQTWWMHADTLARTPPTPPQIAFTEAIVRGDVPAADTLPQNLDAPLPNNMTPMELAVCTRKRKSIEWLAAHGATLDILGAWDMGWKTRARQLLAERPELVNRRTGAWQITPLHTAIHRNDLPLVRLLLTANPDLTIEDTEFHSTPPGWARFFQRTEILALLEQPSASS